MQSARVPEDVMDRAGVRSALGTGNAHHFPSFPLSFNKGSLGFFVLVVGFFLL